MVGTQDPRSTARWRKLRKLLYERDRRANAPCWICGMPIAYRDPPMSPDAWEPDHMLPVTDHPDLAFDPGNIRPAHASCNRSRGSGKAIGIGHTTRNW